MQTFGLKNTNVIYNKLYLQYFTKCGYIGCPEKKYRHRTNSKAENPCQTPIIPPLRVKAQANLDPNNKTTQTGSKQSGEYQPERRHRKNHSPNPTMKPGMQIQLTPPDPKT